MHVSNESSVAEPAVVRPLMSGDLESGDLEVRDTAAAQTVAVLEELLGHSIRLRDLYKYARLHTCDVQFRRLRELFDANYKEQLGLVDVLIDRIRMIGAGGGVFAGDFLQGTQFSPLWRGRKEPDRLLKGLLDAHESVLNSARPSAVNDGHRWVRDFAVGQVVLVNDSQVASISNQLRGREIENIDI
jgi:DNA-binding ferritin-like protein